MTAPSPRNTRFRDEVADCWRFLQRPTLRGRMPGRHAGGILASDWLPGISAGRLLAWAGLLWAINLFALGPIAVAAAGAGGAAHRLDPGNLPWLAAVLWAPLVEEMLFRYGLRRPAQALWVVPALVPLLLWGPLGWTMALGACVMLAACLPLRRGRPKHWRAGWRRQYALRYPLVFHLAALTFAAMHLNNFSLNHTTWWMLPLLVLPQWATGLVLGWMRSRRGIGAAVLLHAVFNAGPVLVILSMSKWFPELGI
ncbi:CPBP family glutamic-type intramembrane protease [Bordetella sp. 2513F-2]